MANPWERDWSGASAAPWERDWGSAQPSEPKEKSGALRRVAQDAAVGLAKGAVAVPQAVVGLADIATGGRVGKFLENEDGLIGFRPKAAQDELETWYTPETQAARKKVQEAEGFVGTAKTMLENPSSILTGGVESLPSMAAGGLIGRGVMAAVPRVAPMGAAAVGEGAVMAGQAAANIREQTADGLLTPEQAALAGATGVAGAAIARVGGAAANKLGIGDLDTAIVQGGAKEAAKRGIISRTLLGGAVEGGVEEMPQSMTEQALQNVALDRPVGERVAEAGAQGLITGAPFGMVGANIPAAAAARQGATTETPGKEPTLDEQLTELEQSVDGFLASTTPTAQVIDSVTQAGSVDEAIEAATAAAGTVTDLARRTGAALAPLMDRQAELAAQATNAGTEAERQGAMEQAAVSLERNAGAPRVADPANFADLAPMDLRTARGRLTVLRDQIAREGGDALSLVVAPHPNTPGKFAIGRNATPSLDVAAPVPAPAAPAEVQQRLETAALTGEVAQRQQGDQARQVVVDRALRSIEERGGVASPAEAQILAEANLGRPYDRVDPSLAPPLSMDEQLTQATGIALDRAPRESAVQTKAPSTEAAQEAAERQASDRQANQQRSDARMASTAAARALGQQSRDMANQQAQAAPVPAEVNLFAIESILKKSPALRNAQEVAILQEAQRTLTPEQMSLVERAATNPPSLSATDRLQLRRMREGDLKFSQQRDPVSEKRKPEGEQAAEQQDPGNSETTRKYTHEESVEVDPATLSDQARSPEGVMSKQTHRFLKALSRLFGQKLVVFQSAREDAPDGYVRKGDARTIYINVRSQQAHLVVFGHELLHQIKATSPKAYEAIRGVIKLRTGADLNVAGINGDMEEVTADLVGNLFADTTFWREVFGQLTRPEAVRLGDVISRVVDRFKRALGGMQGFDTGSLVENLDQVRVAAAGALAQYAREQAVSPRSDKGSVSPQGDTVDTSEERVQKSDGNVPVRSPAAAREEKQRAAGEAARRSMGDRFSAKRDTDERQPAAAPGGQQSRVVSPAGDAPRYGTAQEDSLPAVSAWHFSQQSRPVLSSAAYGQGLKGDGRERFLNAADPRSRKRIYFYVDKGRGIHPESGVGGAAHEVVLENLYDADADPRRLKRGNDWQAFESAVLDAGFDGYLYREHNLSAAAVLLGPRTVRVAYRGVGREATKPGAGVRVGDSKAVSWETNASGPAAAMEAKAARMRENKSWSDYDIRVTPAVNGFAKVETRKKLPVLNVGLSTAEVAGGGQITEDDVRQALQRAGVTVADLEIQQSDTEQTAVVTVSRELTPEEGDQLSRELQQEAIVLRRPDGSGELFGPKAEEWGPYNPEFFVMPGGQRASQGAMRASAKRDATEAFDEADIEQNRKPAWKSREKLVSMRIDDFLALAKQGTTEMKAEGVQLLRKGGKKFNSLPYLMAYRKDGVLKVEGHEGRHRARQLKAEGYETMPVLLRTDIRWSEQDNPDAFDYVEDWPTAIEAEEGTRRLPMPVPRDQANEPYSADMQDSLAGLEVTEEPAMMASAKRDLFPEEFADRNATVRTGRVISSKGATAPGPNVDSAGRRIAATRQGLQNFWAWFGDSEEVDASGRPTVHYHTTRNSFDVFEPNRVTKNSGTFGDWETSRAAMFFTESLEDSQAYGTIDGRFVAGANVVPVYIRAENVLDLTSGLGEADERTVAGAGLSPRFLNNADWSMFDDEAGRELVAGVRAAGYDGVRFLDQNPDTGETFVALAVFEPTQIKSAVGNDETFTRDDPKITSSAKRVVLKPEIAQTLGRHVANLTPAEKAKMRRDTSERFVEIINMLPKAQEMAATAYAARAKRGWYRHSALAIEHVFGADAPRFAALLAAMSPQTSVEANLYNTLATWKNWVRAGRPTTRQEIVEVMGMSVQGSKGVDSVLDAWINNSVRALSSEDPGSLVISGPKVNSFMLNLRGYVDEVTNDAWMAAYAKIDQTLFSGSLNVAGTEPGKGPGYMAMSARVRETAKLLTRLTGETWTPAEVQETVWSWAKTLYEAASVNRSAQDIIADQDLTEAMIQGTPDFRTLFHDDVNEDLLRAAGLGDQVGSLRARSDLAFAVGEVAGAEGQAAPFDRGTQEKLELRAAGRLDRLRAERAAEVKASAKRQTETPEFKRWFGGSKVVDADGKPLVAYHGTNVDFETFDTSGANELGSWFTAPAKRYGDPAAVDDARAAAEDFAATQVDLYGGADIVVPVYLSIKSPKVFRGYGAFERWSDQSADGRALRERLIAEGHDGVVIRNSRTDGGALRDDWVAFKPEQIKSAIGNDGTFDATDPDIRSSAKRQTETPEFKRWFGDSKVVDADGKPLVVYHGTDKDFSAFDPSRIGDNFGVDEEGFFFTSSKIRASGYADPESEFAAAGMGVRRGAEPRSGSNVMPVYLSLQNPLTLDAYTGAFYTNPAVEIDEQGVSLTDYFDDNRMSVMEFAKRGGHDGVLFQHKGKTLAVAFRPEQIKSAIGNDGTFDAGDPDIRSSAKRNNFGQTIDATWGSTPLKRVMPPDTKKDQFLYKAQDKFIDLKRLTEAVQGERGRLGDELKVHDKETLFHGRAAKRTKDFLDFEVMPMLREMRAAGVDLEKFETFLHNRHAPERNRQVASLQGGMPDGGSGIRTADALAYMAALPTAELQLYERFAERIDAIGKGTRDYLVAEGLEKQEVVTAWEDAYKHYVPLNRVEFEAIEGNGTGMGYSVRSATSRRAMGSDKPVGNIIGNLVRQREAAITRAEKNRIGKSLFALFAKHPNPEFALPVSPKFFERDVNDIAQSLIDLGMGTADAMNIAQEEKQRLIEGNAIKWRTNPALRGHDNVLALRVNGEDHYVFFNKMDPRAMRLARSLKNLDVPALGGLMKMLGAGTRWLSMVNTQYNPVFGIFNFMRDFGGALVNLTSTRLAGAQGEIMRNALPALWGILIDLRAHRDGKKPTSSWAQDFEEFQREGGQTGFRDLFASPEDRQTNIKLAMDPSSWVDTDVGRFFTAGGRLKVPFEMVRKAAVVGKLPVAFGWLSDYNEAIENSLRLAAYREAKNRGMSKQEAAVLAKNLTVNFNRKGQIATQAGALYGFFNAATQGTARLVETLQGPAGKRILAGGLLLGVLQALMLAAMGFDDEEPPEFVRDRSFLIPNFVTDNDKDYIALPLPLGLHVLPATARRVTEFAGRGFKDPAGFIGGLLGLYADAFNPIGGGSDVVAAVMPSVFDPAVALARNKDWTGRPIAKQDFSSLNPTPGHTRARDTATAWSTAIAEFLNWSTGGTDFKPGLFSPTPDQIDYLIGQAFGGVAREASKIAATGRSFATGEDLPVYKMPLIGRLAGNANEAAAERGRYYNTLRELNMHEAEIKGRRESGQGATIAEYLRDNPEARLVSAARDAERDVRALQKRKRELVERGAAPETVRLLEERIARRMKQLNDRVRSLREAA